MNVTSIKALGRLDVFSLVFGLNMVEILRSRVLARLVRQTQVLLPHMRLLTLKPTDM